MQTSNTEPQKQNFKHQFYGHSFNVFNLHYLAKNQKFSGERVKGLKLNGQGWNGSFDGFQ
jgi:hypothetical protein